MVYNFCSAMQTFKDANRGLYLLYTYINLQATVSEQEDSCMCKVADFCGERALPSLR